MLFYSAHSTYCYYLHVLLLQADDYANDDDLDDNGNYAAPDEMIGPSPDMCVHAREHTHTHTHTQSHTHTHTHTHTHLQV
jgi:hypothetical protein